ncbi:myosin-like coiled-coil protein-domain-containing protein [Tuber brumale]|nr:myosin-like coiled-coil protein-domain-containing protein [Tuber brumale]
MAAVANTSSMSNARRYALLGASAGYGHPVPGPPSGAGGGAAGSGPGSFEVPVPSADDYGPVSEPTSSNTTPPPPPAAPAGSAQGPAPPHKKAPNTGPKPKKPLDPMEVNNLLTAKISQLETDASLEEEEEKAICATALLSRKAEARAVRRANKELAELVSSREDHLAKVDAIQNKYSELLYEMKRLERDYAKSRKRADQLQKEKDHSRSEMQKAVSMKHKLETLCRELQKENKRIKETQDESKKLAQSEQQKREELSNKFENTIMEIKNRMEEENDGGSCKANAGVDELFKAKFKSLVDQYEMRELHCYSLIRTKELEVQWNLARYEQQRKQAEQEAHRAKALHAQVSTFSQTEAELRSQLNIYVEKFKQVEDTLNNSNDLFLTFRKEMEEMSKKTKRLEKENLTLSRKSDTTNRNLLKMAEERTKHQKELEILRKKNSKLENLCRALQAERTTLDTKLRDQEGGGRGGGVGDAGDGGELLEEEEEEEDDSEADSEYEESDGYDDDASEDGSEGEEGEDDTEDENPQAAETAVPQKVSGGNQKQQQHTQKNGVEKAYLVANGVRTD